MDLGSWLEEAARCVRTWEASWGAFGRHASVQVSDDDVRAAFDTFVQRLHGNYPFFHPRYAGQMLKPPHPVAALGYAAAMLINPNNHALDGGPPTAAMEKDVVRHLAAMFQLPGETLGHLTSSGTIANLEALWVARHCRPGLAIAFSEAAHYTHGRMAEVLAMRPVEVPADRQGRMQLEALEEQLKTGKVGTVVLTAGTTGLGAVDPVADALPLCRRYNARVHVDAAYGGFFVLHAHAEYGGLLSGEAARNFRAIADADSVVIDPHKHGLQPYGCGCILLRDPALGRLYKHDSPYTYFTSDELHLGEISLECSRAGAAAAALWLTLQVLPLSADRGLGPILAACLRAGRRWFAALETADVLRPFIEPELDIVTYFPARTSMLAIDVATQALFEAAMSAEEAVFLSVLSVQSEVLKALHPGLQADRERVRILRSVLMRPEQEEVSVALVKHLDAMACAL